LAIIHNGPLAASVHGSIGAVEFRLTRHGQVAQSKTVSKVWNTPAALLTKNRFRNCNLAWLRIYRQTREMLALAARRARKNATTQWMSSFYRLQQGHPWDYPDTYHSSYRVEIVSYRFDGVTHYMRLGPYIRMGWALGSIAVVHNGAFLDDLDFSAGIPLSDLEFPFATGAWPMPADLIVFPNIFLPERGLGRSVGLHLT